MTSRQERGSDKLLGSLSVTLFRDFPEDRRLSMEVYANSLMSALRDEDRFACTVRQYQPKLPAWLGTDIWSMRVARYAAFPWQARKQQDNINHILDHGYGHLLYFLDPNRSVVTVHDLIPLVRWRGGIPGVSRRQRPWLNLLSFRALRRAAHLIAVSENTRDDLIRFCGCRPEKISVVHYGVDPLFRKYTPEEEARAREKWELPANGTRRVLITGGQYYKNQEGALRAFAKVRQMHQGPLELIKLGPCNEAWVSTIEALGLTGVARCLGHVPHGSMPDLYNCVECLLFPSFYEGHGLPPIEAMACGTPVVASDAASLPEIVGGAAILCSPTNAEELAKAIYRIIQDSGLRRELIGLGFLQAEKFTWEKTARQTLNVYHLVQERL